MGGKGITGSTEETVKKNYRERQCIWTDRNTDRKRAERIKKKERERHNIWGDRITDRARVKWHIHHMEEQRGAING